MSKLSKLRTIKRIRALFDLNKETYLKQKAIYRDPNIPIKDRLLAADYLVSTKWFSYSKVIRLYCLITGQSGGSVVPHFQTDRRILYKLIGEGKIPGVVVK